MVQSMFTFWNRLCRPRAAVVSTAALLATLSSFGTAGFGTALPGVASPIATPGPGNPTLQSAPVPNPNPFNMVSGATASAGEVNTDYFALWGEFLRLEPILNSCAFQPPAGIGAITLASPLTGSLSACSAPSQETLTIGLGIVPLANGGTGTNAPSFSATAPLVSSGGFAGATVSCPSCVVSGGAALRMYMTQVQVVLASGTSTGASVIASVATTPFTSRETWSASLALVDADTIFCTGWVAQGWASYQMHITDAQNGYITVGNPGANGAPCGGGGGRYVFNVMAIGY